jgi:hypothetical protein
MATRKNHRHRGFACKSGFGERTAVIRRGGGLLAFLKRKYAASTRFWVQANPVAPYQTAPESVIPHSLILLSSVL